LIFLRSRGPVRHFNLKSVVVGESTHLQLEGRLYSERSQLGAYYPERRGQVTLAHPSDDKSMATEERARE